MFRQFDEEYKEMDAVELLAEYGIYQTPDFVYFKGEMCACWWKEEIEFVPFKAGNWNFGERILKHSFLGFQQNTEGNNC